MKGGAHAVGVEHGKSYGKAGFVIVAHVSPGQESKIPPEIVVSSDDGDVEVPIVIERDEPFTPS